ncbi:MAG: hypothetical protein R6V37_06480, partial [Psychroflexus maritimus]
MKKNIYLLSFAFLMSCLSFGQENKLDLLQENAFQLIFTDQAKALDLIDSLNLENKNLLPKEQSRNLSLKGVYYGAHP